MKFWRIAHLILFILAFFSGATFLAQDASIQDIKDIPSEIIIFISFLAYVFTLTMTASERFITRFERDTRPWHRPSIDLIPFEQLAWLNGGEWFFV